MAKDGIKRIVVPAARAVKYVTGTLAGEGVSWFGAAWARRRSPVAQLLVALWLFHVGLSACWLAQDDYPLLWDQGHTYRVTLKNCFYLSHPHVPLIDIRELKPVIARWRREHPVALGLLSWPVGVPVALLHPLFSSHRHPPLVYVVCTVPQLVFGPSRDVAAITNCAFSMGVLILGAYLLGARLQGRNAGLVAAVLASAYPSMFGLPRELFLDTALAGMTALSLYCLMDAGDFADARRSRRFGIVMGLALLTKFASAVVMALPVLWVLWVHFLRRRKAPDFRPRFMNLVKAGAWTCGLAAVFYVPFLPGVVSQYAAVAASTETKWEAAARFSLESVSYYGVEFVNSQAGFALGMVSLAGLVLFASRAKSRRALALLGIGGMFLAGILVQLKQSRYTVAYLPLIAACAASGLMLLKSSLVRNALCGLILAGGITQCIVLSFGMLPSRWPDELAYRLPASDADLVVYSRDMRMVRPPAPDEWRSRDVLAALRKDSQGLSGKVKVVALFNWPEIVTPLNYLTITDYMAFRYSFRPAALDFTSSRDKPWLVKSADYVLVKDGGKLGTRYDAETFIEQTRKFLSSVGDGGYSRIAHWLLPDGSRLILYRNETPRADRG